MSLYDYEVETIDGRKMLMKEFEGKALLIVNTASECGFTPQYAGLQQLYEQYREQGLEILGFPSNQFGAQEPGSNAEVLSFCQLRYGVTFPLFAKTDVRGETAHPLFKFLKQSLPGLDNIQWNFAKYLVDRQGEVVARFDSGVEPGQLAKEIEALL